MIPAPTDPAYQEGAAAALLEAAEFVRLMLPEGADRDAVLLGLVRRSTRVLHGIDGAVVERPTHWAVEAGGVES